VAFAFAEVQPVEGGNLAQIFAPYIAAFGLLPLLVGLGVLRHHRVAQVLGVAVGGLYGAFFILTGLRGSPIAIAFGLAFILAALSLVSALRAGER
jgi:hypothetical protein